MKLVAMDISGSDPSLPFYVYLYRDTREGKELAPLYVGKGHDTSKRRNATRARRHWSQPSQNPILRNILSQMKSAGLLPRLEIVARFATEQEAFEHEGVLIARYGRRDNATGTLCNLTDGGEGPRGLVVSIETREKLRITSTNAKADPEVRRSISKTSTLMHSDPDFKSRLRAIMAEVVNRPEVRAAKSASVKASWENEGVRALRMRRQKEALSSPEARERKRSAALECLARPEVKESLSSASVARWGRDGEKQKQSERMREMWRVRRLRQQQQTVGA